MAKTHPTDMPGTLLISTTTGQPGERRHLCRLADGTFALVESWMSTGDWGTPVRRYSVWNLIGSHPSVDQAIDRFQLWNQSGK
tara:strand:- start:1651 stop:1899 length:249 start_codon:yes stop_codon:yes gene_type:complete